CSTVEGADDTDGDGVPDALDIDSDVDWIVDKREAHTPDWCPALCGLDMDGDGLDNAYDPDQGGTALSPVDTDGDGTADLRDMDKIGRASCRESEENDGDVDGVDERTTAGGGADRWGLEKHEMKNEHTHVR